MSTPLADELREHIPALLPMPYGRRLLLEALADRIEALEKAQAPVQQPQEGK